MNHSTFDLSEYISSIMSKLPESQQTDELYKMIERHTARIIVENIRNFMTYEDLMNLMEQVEKNDEKANTIMTGYINRYPKLKEQLDAELSHFENLTASFI